MTPYKTSSIAHQTFSEEQFLTIKDIENQYKEAMLALNSISDPLLTIYGGGRVARGSHVYDSVFKLAQMLGQKGWAVASGGGPGVMEAALKGVQSGGGKSVAFKININSERQENKNDIDIHFTQFAPRKYALRQADAFVFAPGGTGTLDELFELFTLNKTEKFAEKPVFFLDRKFWHGMIEWVVKTVYEERELINPEALSFFKVVDDPEEIMTALGY